MSMLQLNINGAYFIFYFHLKNISMFPTYLDIICHLLKISLRRDMFNNTYTEEKSDFAKWKIVSSKVKKSWQWNSYNLNYIMTISAPAFKKAPADSLHPMAQPGEVRSRNSHLVEGLCKVKIGFWDFRITSSLWDPEGRVTALFQTEPSLSNQLPERKHKLNRWAGRNMSFHYLVSEY